MGASSCPATNLTEATIVGRSLQKLLIFFMMLDAAWMVLGYSFFGPLLSFIFHLIVLSGVKKGRTGILLVYVVLNVIVLSFAAVGLLFFIGALMTATQYTDGSSSSGEATVYYKRGLANLFSSGDASSSSSSSSSDSSFSSEEAYADSFLLAGSIFLLISIVLLYCKIYSVVLAARLRRLLLASPVLPVHVTLPVDGIHGEHCDSDSKPLLAEQPTFDDTNPVFAQPGFVPMTQPQLFYPNIQGAPSMMPPPFMYGQHPVFYTFAPAPPTNEKQ